MLKPKWEQYSVAAVLLVSVFIIMYWVIFVFSRVIYARDFVDINATASYTRFTRKYVFFFLLFFLFFYLLPRVTARNPGKSCVRDVIFFLLHETISSKCSPRKRFKVSVYLFFCSGSAALIRTHVAREFYLVFKRFSTKNDFCPYNIYSSDGLCFVFFFAFFPFLQFVTDIRAYIYI